MPGRVCPVCDGYVSEREDGQLYPHKRFADGAGHGALQLRDMVQCEGGAPAEPTPEMRQEDR